MKKLWLMLFVLLPAVGTGQIITTIAGNGVSGISGDGGPATAARIPDSHLGTFDKYGNYYFSQFGANTIRKINTLGIISTIAGTGMLGYSGDGGPATAATFRFPEGLTCDTIGNLYIADHQNFRIRKINKTTGIITTFAGDGTGADAGDGGQATAAAFFRLIFVLINEAIFISQMGYTIKFVK